MREETGNEKRKGKKDERKKTARVEYYGFSRRDDRGVCNSRCQRGIPGTSVNRKFVQPRIHFTISAGVHVSRMRNDAYRAVNFARTLFNPRDQTDTTPLAIFRIASAYLKPPPA